MTIHDLRSDDCIDHPLIRQQAGDQGWAVDHDGWFWRMTRPGDFHIGRLGFHDGGRVYVSSCADALAYDARFAPEQAA